MKTILIIGAGFSGAVIAARLLRQESGEATRIHLLNGSGRIARGMAYGTQSPEHTLNVPAGNMSAFDEDPDHFLRYAQHVDAGTAAGSFVSRRIYGDYLEWLLNQAELGAAPNTELKRIYRHVTRIVTAADGRASIVTLEGGETMEVDKVVLALGHFPSNNPRVADMAFYDSARYLRDPWDQARLDAIPADAPVLLLGTGLTAVDVAMTLLNRNPERPVTAVSRRGLLPQHHRHTAGKPSGAGAEAIWGDAATVRAQLRAFRQYCRAIASEGRDWREGLALLRPVTADVWLAYPEKERRRFLRHVQPYWDTHRHRLAPVVHERFGAALAAGTVRTLAARVAGFDEGGDGVHVSVRPRGACANQTIRVEYVVNCTGPCSDPRHTNSALVGQLLEDGLICTDRLGLGIDVAEDCAVVGADGRPSRSLFYIGPWLKANYWEATAVPDLRVFARRLAGTLLGR
ncbi:FAD/NAD(P)-binding protein [Pseudoduganella namucuonensis]|uniref:Uncharacterized NAD(P)/FAD-binding protein YdhS n=1 Tax=Pseudoduganella namucuonensis TaxID=1035707 RepID=A0A1I7LRC9_9BURK|nr:FAD/NAD(P)-binding protein [Pseudoduganella namucuonensis]SFV12209.1 Uncharacterized NAD(P)/FAD-binding protein YdhS [Pseudoduganella namucuonensis]